MKKPLLAIGILTLMVLGSITANAEEIVLSSDNTLVLNEAFTDSSVTKLMEQATKLDASLKSGYPIYLFLYTPGGSIQAGLELIEFLSALNRPVHTITLFSASMGFQTVQHLGKRYIFKYGVLMSHKARGGFQGEFGGGLSQLDARFGMWLRRINLMDNQTVSRSGGKQTLKSYRASYDNELWLNGQEAVDQGYADGVVTVKCDLSLQQTEERIESMGFFSVKALFSKCPVKTAPVGYGANILTNNGEMELQQFLIKDGKFGPDCRSVSKYSQEYTADGDTKTVITPPELCAKDPLLTLDKIKESLGQFKKSSTKDLKDHIIYSY